jgi:RNA polymerase II subunit A small phosphatase-like protein
MDPPLLVLDLDETLVWARREPREPRDFEVGEYAITLRPHLETFLSGIAGDWEVGVWTSSGEQYAADVVDRVFSSPSELSFVWDADRCVAKTNPETGATYMVKDLKKLKRRGFRLERVLVVDDSAEKLERNRGNHIRVRPFEGDPADDELLDVLQFLRRVGDEPDFRRIDTRDWRSPRT